MILELGLGIGIAIITIAFISEYVDSTLGMGYGTSLTPILMILGFDPLKVVPAVLLSELITGFLAGFTHHAAGNVNFRPKTLRLKSIWKAIKELGIIESFKRGIPIHLKISLLIAACSIIGTVAAVLLAISLPSFYLKLYIGILVTTIGIVILITRRKIFHFSWKRITFLGFIAAFNKGMSGGGYGPVVTGGQLLAGVDGKNAIGITSLSEGLTCLVGVLTYFATRNLLDWTLAPYLIIGALLSVPFSAYTVKKMKTKKLRTIIGMITIALGIMTLIKIFL